MEHKIPIGTLCEIAKCTNFPHANGKRVVLISYIDHPYRTFYGISPSVGGVDIACESVLVPIYDGGQSSAWSKCLWKPNPNHIPTLRLEDIRNE